MNITHISISRKSVWDLCTQQYKFKYHLKVPIQGEEPIYFLYGKIVHKVAETYVTEKGKRNLGEIARDVMIGNIPLERVDEGHKPQRLFLPNEYQNKLPEHLRSIQKLTDQIGTDGITEHEFRYDLDPPHNREVTGFIDRLIEKDGKFFIIDYKTSKKGLYRKNRHTITEDLQLRTYAKVVQKEYGVEAKNIKAALYYLEGANLIGASFSQASLDSAESELLEAYKQIQQTPPENAYGNVGDWCRRCDYVKICPFYRMS